MNDLGKAGSNAHALSGVSLGYAFTERISAGVSLGHSPRVTPCPAAWTARAAAWASASMPNGAAMPATAGICAAPSPPIPKASNAPARSWTTPRPDPATAASRLEARLSWVAPTRPEPRRFPALLRRPAPQRPAHGRLYRGQRSLPFTYADASYRLTTAYVGATYSKPLSPKLTWSLNAELEQDLSSQGPRVVARAEHVGKLDIGSTSPVPARACPAPRPMR